MGFEPECQLNSNYIMINNNVTCYFIDNDHITFDNRIPYDINVVIPDLVLVKFEAYLMEITEKIQKAIDKIK
jgi:hypothetical protein